MANVSGSPGPTGGTSIIRRAPGVTITAINEPATGFDEWIGYEFSRMRADLRLTVTALARRIGTDVSTINNFEAGAINALPAWQETVRIVDGYAMMLGIDPSRILSRILIHQPIESSGTNHRHPVGSLPLLLTQASSEQTVPVPDGSNRRRSSRDAADQAGRESVVNDTRLRRRRRSRRLAAIAVPFVLVGVLGLWVQSSPRTVYALAAAMPSPMRTSLTAGADYLILQTAPSRDGLKWIDVGDPRARKADKLRVGMP